MMKISKCKKELARIIRESGGWRDGVEFFASTCNGIVIGSKSKPKYTSKYGWVAAGGFIDDRIELHSYLKNWHQTTLSREEYFFLHQNQGLEDALDEPMVEAKPTIDQLLQDWRNADDFAKRKQAEADEAGAMRDERWKVAQVKASELGVTIEVEAEKAEESELAITDWRDLRLGDEVEARFYSGALVGFITEMEPKDYDGERPFRIQPLGESAKWCTSRKFKFIRRP